MDSVVGDEDDVAIAAVTAEELLVGVALADRPRKDARCAFVDSLLASIPIEPYDLEIARVHATLLADTRKRGRVRGAHDLLIAATALARTRTVVTTDASGFEDLPDVALRLLRPVG